MTTRARAEYDPNYLGVKIHVAGEHHVLDFAEGYNGRPRQRGLRTGSQEYDPDAPEATPLRLDDDEARAVYEALAEYFGGIGHDSRMLRKDYDAERARVDKFIDALLRGGR